MKLANAANEQEAETLHGWVQTRSTCSKAVLQWRAFSAAMAIACLQNRQAAALALSVCDMKKQARSAKKQPSIRNCKLFARYHM